MKLRVSEILTLDGVMETPDQWVGPYMDQAIGQDVMQLLGETEAMLFGRRTFEEMAAAWPNRSGDMADLFNGAPKYVVTSTLSALSWNNSHRIASDVAAAVAQLKAQPGGVLLVNGSADLVRYLAQHDLVDEYIFSVAPLVLGTGKRLFPDGQQWRLRLIDAKAYQTGLVRLTYGPATA